MLFKKSGANVSVIKSFFVRFQLRPTQHMKLSVITRLIKVAIVIAKSM